MPTGAVPGAEGSEADPFGFGDDTAAMKTFTNLMLLWSAPALALAVVASEMMGSPLRR